MLTHNDYWRANSVHALPKTKHIVLDVLRHFDFDVDFDYGFYLFFDFDFDFDFDFNFDFDFDFV